MNKIDALFRIAGAAAILCFACSATAQTAKAADPQQPTVSSGLPADGASNGAAIPAGDAPGPTPAGKVELVEGDVRLYDNAKKPRSVKVGDMVNEGDSIVTGKDGELHLDMEDGGFIGVRPDTRMRITRYRAQGDLDDTGIFGLLQGSFRSVTGWIGKFNPRSYRIRTPTATIGIRGTDHEPLVVPPGAGEGEPGTYDKVNAGGSFIQTPHGLVDVPVGKAAFAPHSPKPGQQAPQLLAEVPRLFRATHNEHRIEKRHEAIQQKVQQLREERRKKVLERHAPEAKTKADRSAQAAGNGDKRQEREQAHEKRQQEKQLHKAEQDRKAAERKHEKHSRQRLEEHRQAHRQAKNE